MDSTPVVGIHDMTTNHGLLGSHEPTILKEQRHAILKGESQVKLRLPLGVFRAYLFDCDGTIVDSMPLHYIAWKKALAEYNCVYEEKLFYAWGGRPIREIIGLLNSMQSLNMPVNEV